MYDIYPARGDELEMIKIVKELKLKGTFTPHLDEPEFNLNLTEEELLVLKLRIPFTHYIA
jgi:hypothetical protein